MSSSITTTTTGTVYIDFVLGGKILQRQMPALLQPNPKVSARRNRTMTDDEWQQFCADIEASMDWSHHWHELWRNKSVVVSMTLLVICCVLFVASAIVRSQLPPDEIQQLYNATHTTTTTHYYATHTHYNNNNHPHTTSAATSSSSSLNKTHVFLQDVLPDLCVMLLLITAIVMSISMVQFTTVLQQSVAQVCHDYTNRYQPYHGITFALVQREIDNENDNSGRAAAASIASPTTSSVRYAYGGAMATPRRKRHKLCLAITKQPEEPSSCYYYNQYQAGGGGAAPAFTALSQHPKDQTMAAAPFFDVQPHTLLPPLNSQQRFPGVHIPKTWTEI